MSEGDISMPDELERVSMEEIEAEDAKSLPNKEVMSLLAVNANVDLGLNLAAPVDLAVAANLNVAAPIEAAAAANVLSAGSEAVALAQQHGVIDQGISGSANATADQHSDIAQNANPPEGGAAIADGGATPALTEGGTPAGEPTQSPAASEPTAGAVEPVPGAAPAEVTDPAAGAVDSLLQGGSLLDADVNIHANANLTAPIDGAVAANANVAAPIDAAVAANIGSVGAVSQALADQQVDIHQSLDGVEANADATQDSTIDQK
jgi:hypothetical protein